MKSINNIFLQFKNLENDTICHLHLCSYIFSQSLHLLLVNAVCGRI